MKPKRNLQITTNTNHFPTNLKCNQIISSHLKLYRSCKKTQIAEKSGQMWIILHIALTVQMNTKTYSANCNYYRSGLCIKTQNPRNLQSMSTKPIRKAHNNRRTRKQYFIKNKKTKNCSCKESCNCKNTTSAEAELTSLQPRKYTS